MVVVSGRVSYKEDEASKIIAEEIVPIERFKIDSVVAADNKNTKKELWLKLSSMHSQAFEETKNLLSIFEGDCPVYMFFEDTNQRMRAPRSLWCVQNDLLISELERILGKGNVKVR